jgi:hypothetical protein
MKETEKSDEHIKATGAAINPALPQNRVASVAIHWLQSIACSMDMAEFT